MAWSSVIGGAASGAAAGSSVLPGWGTALGAGVGALGSFLQGDSASGMAGQAMALQQQQIQEMRRQSNLNYQLAMHEMERLQEYDKYQREQNDWSRMYAEQTYDYNKNLLEQNRAQQLEEYQYMLNRQADLDASAAEQRAFEMEQFLKNQQLTEDQREWAKAEYESAKAQALMQREYGVERQNRADSLAALERQFDIDQIYRAQALAESERQYEVDKQQNVLSQIDALATQLNEAVNGFGDLVPLKQYTQQDIDTEAQRRGDLYASAIDRAADRVASVNEADAIRSGMYESTTNNARRANITAQLANEYQQAYGKGYDEAQKYIGGLQGMEHGNRNQLLNEQQQKLAQLMTQLNPIQVAGQQGQINASGVGPQMKAGSAITQDINPYDAVAAYNGMGQVGTGIYEGLPRTGNYADTIDIGSGVYGGSALSAPGFTLNSLSTPDPHAYMQSAADLSKFATGANTMLKNAMELGAGAAQGLGSSLANLDNVNWGNLFGTKEKKTTLLNQNNYDSFNNGQFSYLGQMYA